MMREDIKKDINNSLKEIQNHTSKQVEALKEETQKSLKELQENTISLSLSLICIVGDACIYDSWFFPRFSISRDVSLFSFFVFISIF